MLYPRSTKLNGCIVVSPCSSVRLSVCGQNRVRCVSSTVLHVASLISYLHILSTNFRRCVMHWVSWKIKKFEFWQFLWICNFHSILCPCKVKVKSWFMASSELLLQQLLIFCDDPSRWFNRSICLISIRTGFGQNCNFVFLAIVVFFSIVPFHFVFVVTS